MKVYMHKLVVVDDNLEIWFYDEHKTIIGKLLIERHNLIRAVNTLYSYIEKLPKLHPDAPWDKVKTKEEMEEIQNRDTVTALKSVW